MIITDNSFRFTISCTNDKIWNLPELIRFLSNHQNQHIKIFLCPEAICLQTLGLYDLLDCFTFSRVDIFTENLLETSHRYNIVFPNQEQWAEKWLRVRPTIDPSLHVWTMEKLFLIFYRRPTANRIGLAGHLMHYHSAKSKMHFSWGNSLDEITLYEFDKLASYSAESLELATKMVKHMPLQGFSNQNFSNVGGPSIPDGKPFDFNYRYHDDKGIEMYKDILIDLVSESHVLGDTFYPTEKTFRPMWLKKPFVVFASRNYLDYLHQMGFKTFNNWWSENYDGFESRDRYLKILELIDDLSGLSQEELKKIYQDMQPVLEHNYNLLYNQKFYTKISFIQ